MLFCQKCGFHWNWGCSTRAGILWPWNLEKVWGFWHRYPWFFRHSHACFILGHEKHDKNDSSLLNPVLGQNKHLKRMASKILDLSKENALDWCNANIFTNKVRRVSTKGWKSSHYQALTRVSLPMYSQFDNVWNGSNYKATVLSHSSNYPFFGFFWLAKCSQR